MSKSGEIRKKNRKKTIFTVIGLILATIIALAVAYLLYVFSVYHRIDDHQLIQTAPAVNQSAEIGAAVSLEQEYTIVTYNVGFGAYSPDYTFFMDGGKSSWAKSKESATSLITGAGDLSLSFEPDFVLLQEIDVDSTRTYHLDELELLRNKLSNYVSNFAVNYDSPFLLYPFYEPHGSSYAGIATFSKYDITSAERRSLPISSSMSRFVDLDRCYSVSRIPTENGKELIIINVHMSAYGSSPEVRAGQTAMLREEMEKEYAAGNYVIVGGDYNHNLKLYDDYGNMGWAKAYGRDLIPETFTFAIDLLDEEIRHQMHNSCRDSGKPVGVYNNTITLDGFIISDNIECIEYYNYDSGYLYSDHDPVVMTFVLK